LDDSTETDSVSTTVAVTMRKRRASSIDAASIFASVLSRPATDIEFACSCLQTPTTTSITVTQIALSTTIITPIVSDDLTVTPFTTVQVTETDTITESVVTTATSTLETATTTTVTEMSTVTASVPGPIRTGYLQAKGGVVDGQWLRQTGSSVLYFGSSTANRPLCTIGSDRVLTCAGKRTGIIGNSLAFQIRSDYANLGGWTLFCDTDSNGLLTCDKTTKNGQFGAGLFGNTFWTCNYISGQALNYREGNIYRSSGPCSAITGVYLVAE
jgi:hypothetical protein